MCLAKGAVLQSCVISLASFCGEFLEYKGHIVMSLTVVVMCIGGMFGISFHIMFPVTCIVWCWWQAYHRLVSCGG